MGVTLRLGLDALLVACRRVEPAFGRERPVQGALRLSDLDGSMAIEAHSGELYFRAVVDGGGVSEGIDPILIPGRIFIRFLRALEETGASTVDLKCHGGHDLVVSTEQAEMNLRLIESDAWPSFEPSLACAVALAPRQAAADPTRREQLERLLAEFEVHADRFRSLDTEGAVGGPITYDSAALRRELGLA